MNKKVIITVAAIAVALATVKTGYAFYENQNNNTAKNEIVNASQIEVNTEEQNLAETEATYLNESESAVTDTTNENQTSNCCGGSYGSMLDENGNLKDKDAYEKELDGYVASGEITEEDKEYYLFMYDKCAEAFAASDSETADGSNYPSCH